MKMYDYLIVGAGLSGAILAYLVRYLIMRQIKEVKKF